VIVIFGQYAMGMFFTTLSILMYVLMSLLIEGVMFVVTWVVVRRDRGVWVFWGVWWVGFMGGVVPEVECL
jgi:hypothetical protein